MVGVLSFACDETQPSESNIGPHASIAFVSSIAAWAAQQIAVLLQF